MNSIRNVVFTNVTNYDPQPDDAGTIKINAKVFNGDVNLTFTTTSFIEEFMDDEDDDCQSKQDVNYFLMEARLNDDLIWAAMINLVLFVDQLTYTLGSEDLRRISLVVGMDILLPEPDDLQIEEAVQASLNQTNNIRFRPASKLLVKSLTRKIYNKTNLDGDKCTICLEEFNNGTSTVVTLPCGHDQFDDECMGKWFETSHVCPLCRFELPCED